MTPENTLKVYIRKPLYSTFFYLRKEILEEAIDKHLTLEVTIPQGIGYADPKQWIETGKKITKVFKFENHPMILFGNYLTISKKRKSIQQKLFDYDTKTGNTP